MRFEDYTLDQQKAIISKGSNIIVSAGAGSGKTQVLTARVLHFVKNEHYKLSNFLILTFTNLAAGEMKKRIRDVLTSEHLDEANEVDNADICTFDAYALSIVKKYHFILNVSKDISLIDSNVISVKKRNIIKEIFEEYYTSNKTFKKMVSTLCFKDDDNIQKLVLDFYNNALLELDTDEYLSNFITNFYNEQFYENVYLDLEKKLNSLKNDLIPFLYALPDVKISKKDNDSYQSKVLEGFEEFINCTTYEQIIASLPDYKTYNITKPRGLSDEEKKAIDDYKKEFKEVYEYISSLPKSKYELKLTLSTSKEFSNVLVDIVKRLDQEIKTYKDKYQVFEFQDIAKKALFLVKNNDEVRLSIKNKLKMIMIDEYQDTSALQEAFINQIEDNNVYMVGDVKQSIYRFRNARSDIFTDKYNRYKEHKGGIAIDLNKNFRSRREVLDDINFMFKQLMTEQYGGASYIKDHMIEYGNKAYINAGKIDAKLNSSFIIYQKDSMGIEKEAHLIARDIISKINNHYQVMTFVDKKPTLRDCRVDDFCVLMDRGTNFELFARVFNEYKIPLFIENDENISTNEIVLILTNLLRLIKAIQNNDYSSKEFIKAFLSVTRSFLFEYSDEKLLSICSSKNFYNDEAINKIRNMVFTYSDLPLFALLEKLLFSLDCYHKLILIGNVEKNEKYLDMFLELFKSMAKLDYSLDDFISYLEQVDDYDLKITLSSEGSAVKSVKMMNIHKSKGLEFNICYFAGLSSKFNRTDVKANIGISSKYGLYFPTTSILKDLNQDYEIKEDISEKIRLFYVALTRAREKMIFVMQIDSLEEYFSKESQEISMKSVILNVEENYLKENIDYLTFKEILLLAHCKEKIKFNKEINSEFIYQIRKLTFDNKYSLDEISYQDFLSSMLDKYYNREITYTKLKQMTDAINLSINCGFSSLSFDEQKVFVNTSNAFMEKGQIIDPSKMVSFFDFLKPCMDNSRFEKYTYDISKDKPILSLEETYTIRKKLELKEIHIESKKIDTFKSSKNLLISSSKQAMDFGNDIHFMMEVMDFKNPHFDILKNNGLYVKVIKRFLASNLMTNIQNGSIYKEYAFYDEDNKTNGIIDLMVIYDDYIDVIDYKTKHIDDEDYDKQVLIYKNYVEKIFHKRVNAYLYSLMEGIYKQVL